MRIAFDIPDENRNGNCYETAFQNQIDDSSLLVCHGVVHGQGALDGIEFPHAWNETESETVVIDTSNGNDICMMRGDYYALGRIDESTVFKYAYDEAWQKAIDTGTYGPWEPELDFDYRAAAKRAQAIGNCFETAWDMQTDSLLDEDGELLICHGILTGYGDMAGTEFTHGWNETQDGTIAIDMSNGNDLVMPVWQYYEVMGVQPETVHRYDHDEAYAKAEQYMRYGPWEPELDFVYREAAMRIVDSKTRDEAVKQANLWYWKTYVGRKNASDGLGIDDIGEGDEYEDPDTGDRIEVESRTRSAIYYREVPRDRVLMGYEECRVASVGDFLSTVSGWRRS